MRSHKIGNHACCRSALQPLLPAGFTVATASAGFRNQGEFIAALHVSRNLGIPFDQLKAELTEKTSGLARSGRSRSASRLKPEHGQERCAHG
jgi:hypothetical protein